MKVALIADIHGNRVALDAALADIKRSGADMIVCLGDVVGTGPQPQAVLERLQALVCPVVMGNTDEWALRSALEQPEDEEARRIEELDLWSAQQLSTAEKEYIRSFQPVYRLELDGVSLLCFHGSPRSNMERVEAPMSDEELDGIFAGEQADIMAGGHTHRSLYRWYRGSVIVNPGSVGLPYTYDWQTRQIYNPALAEYALLTREKGTLQVDLRRVSYDLQDLQKAVKASGMPHTDWWLNDWRPEK